ncbi:MAG: hypothetical protein WBA43_04235 [Elainellaceae cyanobacterium]
MSSFICHGFVPASGAIALQNQNVPQVLSEGGDRTWLGQSRQPSQ